MLGAVIQAGGDVYYPETPFIIIAIPVGSIFPLSNRAWWENIVLAAIET